MFKNIKEYLPHIVALVTILLINVIYFYPQLQGKIIQQGDLIKYEAMAHEAKSYEKATGETVLWTNSMFGGMPTYQLSAPQKWNLIKYVRKAAGLFIGRPIGVFIMGMVGFYVLLLFLGVKPYMALMGALFFGLSTNNMILWEAGHATKTATIMLCAPVIAGALGILQGRFWAGGALFTVGLALNLYSNHPQMTYYLALTMIPLVLMYFYSYYKNGNLPQFGKAMGIFGIGCILALGTNASKIWTTLEYSEDTMRGKPILTSMGDHAQTSSETDGLEWSYAMQWSNTPMDLLASFIPKIVGGGSGEWIGKDSPLGKLTRARSKTKAPLYWGGLPFTSGPAYFGAIVFFLFLFGSLVVRGQIKWWLIIAVIFTMMLSLGSNLSWFNKPIFDFVPLFNKFRTPNSVLSVTAVLIPILSILGLVKLVNSKEKMSLMKPLLISTGILSVICLFFAILGPSMFGFENVGDARFANNPEVLDALHATRAEAMRNSSIRTLVFVLIAALAMRFYIQAKISNTALIAIIGIAGVLDLFLVDKNYLGSENFVSKRVHDQHFVPRPVDQQIMKDPDAHYRVLDVSINTFQDSRSSYFHKTIGGYHAAKLQRAQDLIDHHISNNNMDVMNMLNTKYIIQSNNEGQETYHLNSAALGNAWFVNTIREVNTANEEINALSNFDPAGEAIVHKEYSDYVTGLQPQKNGTIQLTKYTPNTISYQSNSTSEQLAVFSEMWYGPDKGWNASINGQPVEHIRANYTLRALRIPAGQHTIQFDFHPKSYYYGEILSLIFSFLTIAWGAWALWKKGRIGNV